MSCHIIPISSIQNLSQIRKLLFPGWKDTADKTTDWQQFDWSWKTDDDSEDGKSEDTWLQNCLITISPAGDVMVIANEDTAIFLTLKWDGTSDQVTNEKFIVTGTESLPASEDFDGITCLFCLPIASQKRPDWTVVIVGTRLGHVRFFTENGILLMSQKFHDEPVGVIKCRTYDPHLCSALAEQNEELSILYKKAVVTIDGFSLYQTLRACRNQVARATAHGGETVAPPQISYSKWLFQEHEVIRDCENIGMTFTNMFDSMMLESITKGIFGHPSLSSPAVTGFVTVGQMPYASFCYTVEESNSVVMRDVALAAASKLKSVISNFFGGSKPAADSTNRKIEPPSPLANRSELRDASRIGEKIFTSPNRRLSVITDEFGRVVLIDNWEGTAIRVWKGYRDAQCGWIEVYEEDLEATEGKSHPPGPPRIANFLVIYGPRRGILEVWAMQQGPRITAFSVPKNARLIYGNHGILGTNSVKSATEGKLQIRRCFFLEPDGVVKSINIPFHYALSAKYSKRARDLHLVNKLRATLKSVAEYNSESISEITGMVLDIKSSSIIIQAMDVLVKDKQITSDLLRLVIVKLKDQLFDQDPDSLDLESKLLYVNCLRKLQIIDLYDNIMELNNVTDSCRDNENEMKPLRVLSGIFNVPELDVNEILGRIDKFFSVCPKKSVRFEFENQMTAGSFLSCFQTNCTHLPKFETFSDIEMPLPLSLSKSIEEHDLIVLASTIFGFIKQGTNDTEDIQDILLKSGVEIDVLLSLLLKCWLEKKENITDHKFISTFYKLLVFICSHNEIRHIAVECRDESPLWKSIRNIFSLSTNIAAAYIAALTCRGVTISLYTALNEPDENDRTECSPKSSDSSSIEWETLNLDIENWNLLVKQLEDIIVLCTILYYKLPPELLAQSLRSSDDENDYVYHSIGVSYVLNKGKGAISELIGKWTCSLHYDALLVLGILTHDDRSDEYFFFHIDHCNATTTKLDNCTSHIDDLKICFEMARDRFPNSLKSDVWIANCCWEFCALWNKDKDCHHYLTNAIRCLKQVSSSEFGKGLAMMLWHTFFKMNVFSIASLIEKVGKMPKDRICRNNLAMSDVAVRQFIGCCLRLLDILLQICSVRFSTKSTSFISEDPWHSDRSKNSLVDIIISQKEPNVDLLLHHYKLAMTLHMIVTFELKSAKPLTLHSTISDSILTKDLSATIAISVNKESHSSISEKQSQFLYRVLTAVVVALPLPLFDDDSSPVSDFIYTELSRSRLWLGKVIELAEMWEVDVDRFRRHYICEMYCSGLDTAAEELLPAVADREVMASQLILIVGQRIFNVIQASGDKYVEYLAFFSPTVTTWFKTLNITSIRCRNPPLSLAIPILVFIVNSLPERGTEHKLASSLLDPVQHVINSMKNS